LISQIAELAKKLKKVLWPEMVLDSVEARMVYAYDATACNACPMR